MTDRELLELAAKAAGIVGRWERVPDLVQERWYFNVPYDNQGMLTGFEWNPLRDDNDAFRLLVKKQFKIVYWGDKTVVIFERQESASTICFERLGNDPYAATRRAIVRAVAEIGKCLKTAATAVEQTQR